MSQQGNKSALLLGRLEPDADLMDLLTPERDNNGGGGAWRQQAFAEIAPWRSWKVSA